MGSKMAILILGLLAMLLLISSEVAARNLKEGKLIIMLYIILPYMVLISNKRILIKALKTLANFFKKNTILLKYFCCNHFIIFYRLKYFCPCNYVFLYTFYPCTFPNNPCKILFFMVLVL